MKYLALFCLMVAFQVKASPDQIILLNAGEVFSTNLKAQPVVVGNLKAQKKLKGFSLKIKAAPVFEATLDPKPAKAQKKVERTDCPLPSWKTNKSYVGISKKSQDSKEVAILLDPDSKRVESPHLKKLAETLLVAHDASEGFLVNPLETREILNYFAIQNNKNEVWLYTFVATPEGDGVYLFMAQIFDLAKNPSLRIRNDFLDIEPGCV